MTYKDIVNSEYEVDEWCSYCNEEFHTTIIPIKGIEIICPNCGAIQNPCSLCDSDIAECNEGRCKCWIIESLIKWNEEN